jgi:hypothetical protein
MHAPLAPVARRCTAWAVCLGALGVATVVALRAVEISPPGPFPDGHPRFAAILPATDTATTVIQVSATSTSGRPTAVEIADRLLPVSGDLD